MGLTADSVELSIFAVRVRNIARMVGSNMMRSVRSTLMQRGDLAAGVLGVDGAVIARGSAVRVGAPVQVQRP